MKTIIACLLIVASAYIYKRLHSCGTAEALKHKGYTVNFNQINNSLDSLLFLKEKLSDVENMITDIEKCQRGESAVGLNITACGRSVDLVVNNGNEDILKALYSERLVLRSSIVKELQKITPVCHGNVTKTVNRNSNRG